MKTFRQFRLDASAAITKLVAEAEGFKDAIKKKKRQKSGSKRDLKVSVLKKRPNLWPGLESVEYE